MAVGETELGKTTFTNDSFLSNIDRLKTLSTTKVIKERTFYLIINDINNEGIKIYNFPEDNTTVENIESRYLPYAIVCSINTIINKDGLKIRVRQYSWGQVEVDNLDHNDFLLLKNNLMKKHLIDLILDTNIVRYENYTYTKLSQVVEKNDNEGSLILYFDFDIKIKNDCDKGIRKKEQVFTDNVNKRINIIERKEKHLDIIINEKINVLDNKKRCLEKLSKEVEKIKICCSSSFICYHKHSLITCDT